MLDFLRKHYQRWKGRTIHLFGQVDEGVEAVLMVAILWQAWRMHAILVYHANPELTIGLANVAGAAITLGLRDLWTNSLGNLALIDAALWIAAAASLVGLMEQKTLLRLIGTIMGAGWWLVSGTLLTLHTPLHDGGGLYFVLFVAGALIYIHRMAEWDREHNFALIGRLAVWYDMARHGSRAGTSHNFPVRF